MVEPLSSLREGEIAEVVWIISEADIRDMLGRNGFLSGETVTCLFKKPGTAAMCIQNTQTGGCYAGRIYKRDTGTADIISACQYLFCNYNAL